MIEKEYEKSGVIFDMDGLMFDAQYVYDSAFKTVLMKEYGLMVPNDTEPDEEMYRLCTGVYHTLANIRDAM